MRLEKNTTMSAAFLAAGIRPEDVEFDRAIARAIAVYLNNGGTIDRAYERLVLAAEKLPEGPASRARNGLEEHADRQPNPLRGGQHSADKIAPTAREPSTGQIEAMAKARAQAAKSIFDRVLTITGRAWGNITYRELREYAKDGEFARALMVHIGSKTGKEAHKPLRDLIDARAFGMIVKKCDMVSS